MITLIWCCCMEWTRVAGPFEHPHTWQRAEAGTKWCHSWRFPASLAPRHQSHPDGSPSLVHCSQLSKTLPWLLRRHKLSPQTQGKLSSPLSSRCCCTYSWLYKRKHDAYSNSWCSGWFPWRCHVGTRRSIDRLLWEGTFACSDSGLFCKREKRIETTSSAQGVIQGAQLHCKAQNSGGCIWIKETRREFFMVQKYDD